MSNMFKTQECAKCKKDLGQTPDEDLKCKRCKFAFYCSRECKTEDWQRHKVEECKAYHKQKSIIMWLVNNKGKRIKVRETHKDALIKLKQNEGCEWMTDEEFMNKGYPVPPGYRRWEFTEGYF